MSRGGELVALMRELAKLRRKVEQRIAKIRDPARRHELEEAFSIADAPFQEAHELGHGFRWDDWELSIEEAQQGLQYVFTELKKKR